MSYTDNANITNAEGACTFFRLSTPEEAKPYNRLMDESFTACEREEKDIYEIGLQEMQSYLSA